MLVTFTGFIFCQIQTSFEFMYLTECIILNGNCYLNILLGDKDIDGNLQLHWIFMKIIEENLNKTAVGENKE